MIIEANLASIFVL